MADCHVCNECGALASHHDKGDDAGGEPESWWCMKHAANHDAEPIVTVEMAELMEENPEALFATGFADAFVGTCRRFGQPPLAAYDRGLCIDILVLRDGMTYEEAEEFFEFNVIGAWMGDHTPVFLDLGARDVGFTLISSGSETTTR